MRRPIVAANWKMYKTSTEAVDLVQGLTELVAGVRNVEIVVCPPFTSLGSVSAFLKSQESTIGLGAQNMYWEDEGAYTGEISPPMLKELGVQYVIIGHSERRGYFGEGDEMVNKKVAAAIAHGLNPIVCVGESLQERESGKTQEVIRRQIFEGLKGLSEHDAERLIIAYEPIWAIGTGRSASAQDANDVTRHIRALIGTQFGPAVAKNIRIQYGGSVKAENINEFMVEPDIDGALVGGASLDAQSFAQIVKSSG